ncbi:hypothetical protein GCM10012287_46400 [Streptomyces daqingensis]|uniref:Uncharacterized protein n=1 Tax=Streptomyces daqingensis TaxID=1472640 RepID=A0ABQ2MN26_9ACTN|nr:hypothetical protein GCM10012287_46400 [Streptomyces daqingensis]
MVDAAGGLAAVLVDHPHDSAGALAAAGVVAVCGGAAGGESQECRCKGRGHDVSPVSWEGLEETPLPAGA